MPKNDHARNVDGLRLHAKSKSEDVRQRIDAAISTLSIQNMPVNFNSVASLANISKTTLYSNPAYRDRIESLRCNTASTSTAKRKKTVTDNGKDVLIAAKNKRIADLEAEVARLSGILKHFYANEYDKY